MSLVIFWIVLWHAGESGPSSWFWDLILLYRCHSVSTACQCYSFSAASSTVIWLSSVLFAPGCPPEDLPWRYVSKFLLHLAVGRAVYAVFVPLSASSQWRSSTLTFTARDFDWTC
jgi:hypothetical protein